MTRRFLRRSIGRGATPVLAAVIAFNATAHSRGWRYEWLRAFLQYHFVTLFLGPIVAGVGAWEAGQWARSSPPSTGGRGRGTTLGVAWAATAAWLVAVYLVGLAAVSVVVLANGVPGPPDARTVATLAPALLLFVGWLGIGYLLGATLRAGPVVAPFVALLAFAGTIAAWTGLPGHLVEVGGATASLVGLRARPPILAGQAVTWLAILGVCAAGIRADLRRTPLALASLVLAVAASVGGAVWLAHVPGDRLELHAGGVRCAGRPVVCLAPGYEQFRPRVEQSLRPVAARAAALGLPTPRFTQDLATVGVGTANLGTLPLRGDPEAGAVAWVNGYFDSTCAHTEAQAQAFATLWDVLVGGGAAGAPPVTPPPSRAALQTAVRTAGGCATTTAHS